MNMDFLSNSGEGLAKILLKPFSLKLQYFPWEIRV